MSLYALGDLHLSFQTNKPMDAFGRVWKHHERKIEKYVNQIIKYLPRDGAMGSLKGAGSSQEEKSNRERRRNRL